jgi:hypothetical protein
MPEEAIREVSVILGARSARLESPQAIFGTLAPGVPLFEQTARTAQPALDRSDITKSLPELKFVQPSIAGGRGPLAAWPSVAARRMNGADPAHGLIRVTAADVERLAQPCSTSH